MSVLSRLDKLEEKLKPEKKKIYFIGWAGCEYKQSNGLTREIGETKQEFFKRVKASDPNRIIHWFN
jgi:hypothetical protein